MVAEVKQMENKYAKDVEAVLKESMDMGFTEITVIGLTGDGLIHIKESRVKNVIEKIGSLEIAKLELFKTWE